jgi:hypothetical protein
MGVGCQTPLTSCRGTYGGGKWGYVEGLFVAEILLNVLEGPTLGLRDPYQGEQNSDETTGRIKPKGAAVAYHVGQVGEGLDHDEELEVGEADGDAAEQRPHFAGEELADVQEGYRSQPNGVGHHVQGDAKQWQPSDVIHMQESGFVRVHGQAENGHANAHNESGAANEDPSGDVLDGGNVEQGSDKLDETNDHSRKVLVDLARSFVENVYGVKRNGKISRKSHQNEQKVQDQEGPSVLPPGQVVQGLFEGELIGRRLKAVGNGQKFSQRIRVFASEVFHDLQSLFFIAVL